MEVGVFEILSVIGTLFLILYYYGTSTFNFWQQRNVKGPKPIPFVGNFKDIFLGRIHAVEVFEKFYNEFKSESVIGIFQYKSPALLVKDPDLIKDVLIKDFNMFADRHITEGKTSANPLSQNLIYLEHEKWRPLRNRLSPVFTSGKLKDMFYLIAECAEQLEKYLEKLAERNEPVECHELTAKFATQTIGLCVFGIDTHSLADEDSEFRKQGRILFGNDFKLRCTRKLRIYAPRIYKLFFPWIGNNSEQFFIGTMKDTMNFRKTNNVRRNDLVDLLMDLQNQPETFSDLEFTDSLLIAQAVVFFVAGFETASITMSNVLYELAVNPDVQVKLREEIKNVIREENGKLTYDSIKRMKYLDKILKETLRKYAVGSNLERVASVPYTFDKINVSIPEGTKVFIPIWAIHHDAQIYPKPEVFDPERFSEEIEETRHPMNYLPFGDGPRHCIGTRFAKYQMKIGIITLIHKYKFELCEKTMIPYRILSIPHLPAPVGIQLNIVKV